MKNKQYSCCRLLIIYTLATLFVFISFVFLIISALLDTIHIITSVLGALIILPFLCALLMLLNRFGCVIWYDEKKKTINRKGLFIGFRYVLQTNEILNIEIVSIYREGDFIIIYDKYNKYTNGYSKKSYIRLEYNEAGINFINLFWNKQINRNDSECV